MRPDDFRKIEDFLRKKGYNVSFARTACWKYIENVESSINEKKKDLNRELTEEETRQICNNFLNPTVMGNYLELSKASQEIEEESYAKKYDRERGCMLFLD